MMDLGAGATSVATGLATDDAGSWPARGASSFADRLRTTSARPGHHTPRQLKCSRAMDLKCWCRLSKAVAAASPWHTGDLRAHSRSRGRQSRSFSLRTSTPFVTNAAGCGSAMHEYHLILKGTPDENRAESFRKRVMDVSVFLTRLGVRDKRVGLGRPQRVTYHDACHLANAQNVPSRTRDLLRSIPGVS